MAAKADPRVTQSMNRACRPRLKSTLPPRFRGWDVDVLLEFCTSWKKERRRMRGPHCWGTREGKHQEGWRASLRTAMNDEGGEGPRTQTAHASGPLQRRGLDESKYTDPDRDVVDSYSTRIATG